MPKYEDLVRVFIIAAVTLCVYQVSFNNSFVYDDYPFLVDNPAVRVLNVGSVVSNFTQRDTVSSDDKLAKDVWRPLVTTSFAIDYRLWKLDNRLYHVENTLLHIANAILVYIITVLIVNSGPAACIAALIFAIHPVQTEAVVWISGRSNVLFLFFFLLAFMFHVLKRKGEGSRFNYGLLTIFFALSLFSKEMAIVLPLVCILYDIYFNRKESLRSYIAYYAPLFLIAACYVVARFSVLGVIAQQSEWWGGSIFANMLLTVKALAHYMRLLIFPVNQKVEYTPSTLPAVWDGSLAFAGATLVFIAVLYIIFRRKRTVSFYIAWFFVTLIPVYNIVPFKAIMAERFLYLPLIAFASLFGILAVSLYRSFETRRSLRVAVNLALSLVIASYAMLTVERAIEWRDEVTFYMKEALRSPANPKSHYNFGYACAKEAQRDGQNVDFAGAYYMIAIDEFRKTIALKNDSQIAYVGLANAYNSVGLYDKAITNFRKALVFKENSDVYNNLGVAYYRQGRHVQAEQAFRNALLLDPNHINATINMGNSYCVKSEFVKARRAWLRALRLGGNKKSLEGKIANLNSKR